MSLKQHNNTRRWNLTLAAGLIAALLLAFTGATFAKKGGGGGGNGGGNGGGGEDPPPPPPITYLLTILNGDGDAATAVVDMNDSGDVVGSIYDASGERAAALWPAGSADPIELNGLVDPALGVDLRSANAINNAGQIAGFYVGGVSPYNSDVNYRLTVDETNPSVFEPIGGAPSPEDINDAGDIAWGAFGSLYVYTDELGLSTIANPIDPEAPINGNAINTVGEIAVSVKDWFYGSFHAYVYSVGNGTFQELAPGSAESHAFDVNDGGDVVGSRVASRDDLQASLWSSSGGEIDLGTLGGKTSAAMAINNNGLIVGHSTTYSPRRNDPPAPDVAFLYIDGQMYPLFAEVADGGLLAEGELPPGWDQLPSTARRVNDADQITGWVEYPDGTFVRYVLTPVAP